MEFGDECVGGPGPASAMVPWGLARVEGDSMRPTLAPGDRLLISYRRPPRAGRLAVVRLPERAGTRVLAVKRLVRREAEGWWVERDNPVAGVDSWLVGAINESDVLAVVLARVWPWRARKRGRRCARRRAQ
ncbi:MAG: S24 family peptidase [Sporichthyaceae bacterium]